MLMLSIVVLVLLLMAAWVTQLVGLPGNWMIVAAAALYAWLWPGEQVSAIGWRAVIILLVLAVAGEVAEFVAGALGVSTAGGSRRGALLAIAGSMIGGIAGLFVGLPIPLVGSLVSAVLFGGLGALAGAMLGEAWKGRDFDTSLQIGKAAFLGRMLGTVAKLVVCTLMVIVTLGALAL